MSRNDILKRINNKTTDYFIIKQKVDHKFYDIVKYKNNLFNRILLSIKRFGNAKNLYIVPEFNGVEGYYYRLYAKQSLHN